MIEISIILPAYKRPDLLVKTLDAISHQTYPQEKWELVLSNDGAFTHNRNALDAIRPKIKNIQYVESKRQGSAKARMNAFALAKGNIFAFCDSDTLPCKNWLAQIKKAFDENPQASAVEGKIITTKMQPIFTHVPRNGHPGIFLGCNTHYKRDVIFAENNGYFNEFFFYREDTSLAFKAKKYGEIIYAPKAKMTHLPKEIYPSSIVRNLRFVKEDWVLFRRYPKQTIDFFGKQWTMYLLISIFAWSFLIAGPVGLFLYTLMRYRRSYENKTYSTVDGIKFMGYSFVRDLFYPIMWLGYFFKVMVLNKPAKDELRINQ